MMAARIGSAENDTPCACADSSLSVHHITGNDLFDAQAEVVSEVVAKFSIGGCQFTAVLP